MCRHFTTPCYTRPRPGGWWMVDGDGEVWVAAVLWLATRQLISLITDTNIMMMVVLVMDCVQ